MGHGQIGRWKASHHMLQRAFSNLFYACTHEGLCAVRNDGTDALAPFLLNVSAVRLSDGASAVMSSVLVNLGSGPGAIQTFCVIETAPPGSACPVSAAAALSSTLGCTPATCVLKLSMPAGSDMWPLLPPANMTVPAVTVTLATDTQHMTATVSAPGPALYVTLTTSAPGWWWATMNPPLVFHFHSRTTQPLQATSRKTSSCWS